MSVLQLDLKAPPSVGGWRAYLTGRGIPIVLDHIGRDAISSADARQLLDEQRENDARKREAAARTEQRAIEADKQWRAQLPKGLPWYAFPDSVSPAEAWRAAELAAQPKRTSVLEETLSNSGTMVYHPLPSTDDES